MSTVNTFGWQQVHARGGCSAKLSGAALAALLASVHKTSWEFEDASDLVRCGDDHLLGAVDFAPPAHPDPYVAGEIAALNALSDLYATGATPCAALAICSIDTSFPLEIAQAFLAGLTTTAQAEGAAVVGGHTITGPEFLAGLAVVGRTGKSRLHKRGATPGCDLLLSKPLGTSSVIWAYTLELCEDAAFAIATDIMRTSNRDASVAAVASAVQACTDVTGFGLLGHLAEMLAPPIGASIDISAIPMHPVINRLPDHVLGSASIGANTAYVCSRIAVQTTLPESRLLPLYDAQTNGGLLVAAPPERRESLEANGFKQIGVITNEHAVEIH
ncbi:MAG TPA: selenide, water dikinase SelD [Thermoanaerobaculia bacterium]|nr:selenide, water dikinase SelD [Thermoanaerobaculia bacterium]